MTKKEIRDYLMFWVTLYMMITFYLLQVAEMSVSWASWAGLGFSTLVVMLFFVFFEVLR